MAFGVLGGLDAAFQSYLSPIQTIIQEKIGELYRKRFQSYLSPIQTRYHRECVQGA